MAKKAQEKATTKKSVKTSAKSSVAKAAKTTAAKPKTKSSADSKKTTKTEKVATKVTQKKAAVVKEVKATPAPKKVKKIKGYSKKDLEAFKVEIMAKREEIIEQLQNLKEQMMDTSTGQYVNESSPYSLHMAEQGTDAQEREKLYLWAQRENKFLGYLEEALQRIENGTYGICIDCIEEPKNLCPTCPLVPKDRLMAVPHTQMCVQIKMAQKK